jgi:hypothetical protein
VIIYQQQANHAGLDFERLVFPWLPVPETDRVWYNTCVGEPDMVSQPAGV